MMRNRIADGLLKRAQRSVAYPLKTGCAKTASDTDNKLQIRDTRKMRLTLSLSARYEINYVCGFIDVGD
jgi:hypothetical protein